VTERDKLGRLRVGFTGSMTYALLPALAKALRTHLPRVALELRGELLTPEQVHRLAEGHLDVGFLRPPIEHADLAIEPMGAEALVAVLPRGHPLAARDAIPVASLEDEPFVTYPSHHVVQAGASDLLGLQQGDIGAELPGVQGGVDARGPSAEHEQFHGDCRDGVVWPA
jgi:DNA-binding transcriptional LysR family regulator